MLVALVLFLEGPAVVQAAASPSSPSSSFADDLTSWIQARCGNGNNDSDNVALWVYEGALFDPLEGRKIANVEGLELVRCVASGTGKNANNLHGNSNNNNIGQKVLDDGDLEVGPLLRHPNATYDHASTILSRKLFCYQSPKDPTKLLTSIRLRPNAPLRKIPTKQAVAVYDTATTFVARGQELLAHTEWPDRQSIWGRVTRKKDQSDNKNPPVEDTTKNRRQFAHNAKSKSFDFTIYARLKSANKKPEQLFDLTTQPTNISEEATSSSVVSSPRRAKLIEFGTGSTQGKDKFGARETYSYTFEEAPPSSLGLLQRLGLRKKTAASSIPNCRVRYSRYGEGPPFFGPGRICSLELQGRRVTRLDDLPPLTASVVADRMSPLFLTPKTMFQRQSDDTGSDSVDALAIRLAENEPEDFWLPDYLKEQGSQVWSKIQGAISGNRK